MLYIAAFNISFDSGDNVHPLRKAHIAHLKVDEAFTEVFSKYVDFANIFSLQLAAKFSEHIGINNYTIKVVDN